MHEHKSKCDSFGDFMGQKYGQGSTCLPQTAAGPVLRSLDLAAAPRTADHLCSIVVLMQPSLEQ